MVKNDLQESWFLCILILSEYPLRIGYGGRVVGYGVELVVLGIITNLKNQHRQERYCHPLNSSQKRNEQREKSQNFSSHAFMQRPGIRSPIRCPIFPQFLPLRTRLITLSHAMRLHYQALDLRQFEQTCRSAQSSSKIWYVFCRIVSTTRTCQPASAMLAWALVPSSVGPNTIARFWLFILLDAEFSITRWRCNVRARRVA